ncbi:lytic transglycosylase domain-containing protein [Agromyces ramosus]|uniref:aggregation-promoting factor C-terminal-like domain-containing protein n=1 Tax=Agromyces ramosus TaxID=33879 RepID=UPI00403883D4
MKDMQNQNPSPNSIETQNEPAPHGRRARRMSSTGWRRGPILAAGAVAAIGAMVGTGFAVQSAVAAQSESVAATAALTEALNPDIEQLGSHAGILEARAVKQAADTLTAASATLAAAQGKADASQLSSSVAALDDYKLLAPERVFELVDATETQTATVHAAVVEADRIAAEQAAAAAAAAAAAKAAADAAAEAEAEAGAGTSGPVSRPSGPSNPSGAQAIARDMLAQRGWGDDQFGCLVSLWNKESGWNVYASNPSSGAYGIPQALPGSKMATAGADWQTNAATQISWGLGYISARYGTPCAAWDTSESQGWY